MALISPGVEVTVIDESQFTPTAAGTVAYVLIATAENKLTPSGTIASYTVKDAASRVQLITSQRDLIQNFGQPIFQQDANGNPLHGDERNEYGLLAAYSALGVSNRVYVQRADIDLNQLLPTAIRPTGSAADGTYWFDLGLTSFGVFEWGDGGDVFGLQNPRVISNTTQHTPQGVPLSSIGAIGEYAVVVTRSDNPVYYKNSDNNWVLVGSDDWKFSVPTIVGSIGNPSNLTVGDRMVINSVNVIITNNTVEDVANDINSAGITGVKAKVDVDGQLQLFVTANAATSGNIVAADGNLFIGQGTTIGGVDCAVKLGLFDTNDTGNTKTVFGPVVQFSGFRNVPAWKPSDDIPRPYGSVWFKTSATGSGANWAVKEYSGEIDAWIQQATPLYENDFDALVNLDPTAGGAGLLAGTLYVRYDNAGDTTGKFRLYRKNIQGILRIFGGEVTGAFVPGDEFVMSVSVPGELAPQSATIVMSGTTAQDFVADILSANLPNIVAAVESNGSISISHLAGGLIEFEVVVGGGTPLTTAKVLDDSKVINMGNNVYLASPFAPLTYTYSTTAPFSNPESGILWYYSNPLDVDILINDGSGWKGYRNVANDARGFDLTNTDPGGVILSATSPSTQSDGTTPVVPGDLWLDTLDVNNWPSLYRYSSSAGWEAINKNDRTTTDGIVFADARWDTSGQVDPIVDDLVPVADMLTSNYIDDDCPDFRLYPRGTLLFNTRRSGMNVKRFEADWFGNEDNFPGTVNPDVKSAWVSHSGVDANGLALFGKKAQRNVVIEALKAAIEGSTNLREEQTEFNLVCCPGYPELIQNMITLNNDRKQTAFIIGDSPLTLPAAASLVEGYANNVLLQPDNNDQGLVSNSEYLGVYYPSGLGTDLTGNAVAVPASHMMLRTYIRSDNVSYPWFAPAGVRRGVIDNVSSIGFVDANTGVFRTVGVTAGLRDAMYAARLNPLTVLPGVGLVAYGQKTRSPQTSAMDRVNVARLVCYLRLVLDKVARPFVFEPNDTITRNQVKAAFEAVLNDVVAKRGIYDYLVVCDTSNNTPDRIDRNELYVDIAIKPVKAIEFIYVPVRIRNTGAEL